MNIIKKLLSDVQQNKKYKIPVLLFIISSLLYLFGSVNVAFFGLAFCLQIIFGIWLIIVAFINKFKMWPILFIGLVFFVLGVIFTPSSTDKFTLAKYYYDQKQYFIAKDYLREIENEYRDKKDYIELRKKIDEKIIEANNALFSKAKNEFNQNKLNDSKETLKNILQYDPENKEAIALLKKIQDIEQKQNELKNKDKISNLTISINMAIASKDFSKAKQILYDFLKENPEIKKESPIIVNLQNKITYSENQKIINENYSEALKYFNNKEYDNCISKLNDILKINNKHLDSKKLLSKAEKLQKIENDKFWTKVKIGSIIVLIIIAIIIYDGESSSCPSCKKWWSKKFVDKQIANKESFYKTIIRKDVTKDRYGKVISITERPEQVHMIKVTYDNYYICSKCSYKWTEQTEEEYEG